MWETLLKVSSGPVPPPPPNTPQLPPPHTQGGGGFLLSSSLTRHRDAKNNPWMLLDVAVVETSGLQSPPTTTTNPFLSIFQTHSTACFTTQENVVCPFFPLLQEERGEWVGGWGGWRQLNLRWVRTFLRWEEANFFFLFFFKRSSSSSRWRNVEMCLVFGCRRTNVLKPPPPPQALLQPASCNVPCFCATGTSQVWKDSIWSGPTSSQWIFNPDH